MFFNLVVTSTCKESLNWTTDVTSDISPKRWPSMKYTLLPLNIIRKQRSSEVTVAGNTQFVAKFSKFSYHTDCEHAQWYTRDGHVTVVIDTNHSSLSFMKPVGSFYYWIYYRLICVCNQ